MSTRINLMDIDNRDESGSPFEFVGSPDQIIGYLDNPLRNDLRESAHFRLDVLIALLRAKCYSTAFLLAKDVGGIGLRFETLVGDDIQVMTLGEDGDFWLATGTSDAWAAEEAVRAHFEYETGEDLNELYPEETLGIHRHEDLKWDIGGLSPTVEEDDVLISGGIEGERFAGFLATL